MTIKQIDAALEEGESLKAIAQAYSEIANLKIKKIRAEVERNRIFFQEIAGIYSLVKDFASKQKASVTKAKKAVSIVLTSNYRFYGTINSDLLEYFEASTAKYETDFIYLGKAAIDYFRARPAKGNHKEVLLKDDSPTPEELKTLAFELSSYNQVYVFYSGMKSLLVQEPKATDIRASQSAALSRPQGKHEDFKFIFEPELSKILEFFDSQIITLLLEGAFLESELSRTASRFISMDQAETQANKFIREYQALKAYTKRNMDNNTILENYAAMISVRRDII